MFHLVTLWIGWVCHPQKNKFVCKLKWIEFGFGQSLNYGINVKVNKKLARLFLNQDQRLTRIEMFS